MHQKQGNVVLVGKDFQLRHHFIAASYPGTDFVILAQADDGLGQMAAIGYGRQVVVFSYASQDNLVDHLDLLTQMTTSSK